MVNAFPLAGCLHSTLEDFVSIEELKIMDSWEQDRILRDLNGRSARELKSFAQNNFGATFQSRLMPFEFDYCFYDWSGLSSYKRLFSEPSYFIFKSQWLTTKVQDISWNKSWKVTTI